MDKEERDELVQALRAVRRTLLQHEAELEEAYYSIRRLDSAALELSPLGEIIDKLRLALEHTREARVVVEQTRSVAFVNSAEDSITTTNHIHGSIMTFVWDTVSQLPHDLIWTAIGFGAKKVFDRLNYRELRPIEAREVPSVAKRRAALRDDTAVEDLTCDSVSVEGETKATATLTHRDGRVFTVEVVNQSGMMVARISGVKYPEGYPDII